MVNILIVNNLLKEKKIIEVRILETFFKSSHVLRKHACLIGNITLIKLLIPKKKTM